MKPIGKGKKCKECQHDAFIRSYERQTGEYYPFDL